MTNEVLKKRFIIAPIIFLKFINIAAFLSLKCCIITNIKFNHVLRLEFKLYEQKSEQVIVCPRTP